MRTNEARNKAKDECISESQEDDLTRYMFSNGSEMVFSEDECLFLDHKAKRIQRGIADTVVAIIIISIFAIPLFYAFELTAPFLYKIPFWGYIFIFIIGYGLWCDFTEAKTNTKIQSLKKANQQTT